MNLFEDAFHFFTSELPKSVGNAVQHGSSAADDTAHDLFNAWQQAADDFFEQAQQQAEIWGPPVPDFVNAWQQATESFADQWAHLWGWNNDNSPI